MKDKIEKYIEKLEKDSNKCPHCNSTDITAEPFDPEAMGQEVTCDECSCSWWEVYERTGFDNIEIPEDDD